MLTGVVPPVRLRNAESSDAGLKTLVADGYQYFALGMGRLPADEANEFVAPVALRVEVVGEEEGVPELAGEAQGPLAEATDGTSATGPVGRRPGERLLRGPGDRCCGGCWAARPVLVVVGARSARPALAGVGSRPWLSSTT